MSKWDEITNAVADRIYKQDDGVEFRKNVKTQADIAKLEIFEQYEAIQ